MEIKLNEDVIELLIDFKWNKDYVLKHVVV